MERIFSGGRGKIGQEGSPFSFLTLSPANEPAKVKHCLGVHTYFQQKVNDEQRCNTDVIEQEIQLYQSAGPLGWALGLKCAQNGQEMVNRTSNLETFVTFLLFNFYSFSLEVV